MLNLIILPNKSKETGNITDIIKRVHRRGLRWADNIISVGDNVAEDRDFIIGYIYYGPIIDAFGTRTYNDTHGELKPRDHRSRKVYTKWVLMLSFQGNLLLWWGTFWTFWISSRIKSEDQVLTGNDELYGCMAWISRYGDVTWSPISCGQNYFYSFYCSIRERI